MTGFRRAAVIAVSFPAFLLAPGGVAAQVTNAFAADPQPTNTFPAAAQSTNLLPVILQPTNIVPVTPLPTNTFPARPWPATPAANPFAAQEALMNIMKPMSSSWPSRPPPAEEKAPEPTPPAPPTLTEAVRAYHTVIADAEYNINRQTASLLKKHIAALDNLHKLLTQPDQAEDAKAVRIERDRAAAELADLESTLPKEPKKPLAAEKTKPAKKLPPKEAAAFGGHHYLFVADTRTWHEAKTACEEMGGHLVTIANREENDFACKLAGGKPSWIGLTDEAKGGEWKWVTGERLSFEKWGAGQPSNTLGVEHYAHWLENRSGAWNDSSAETKMGCVCEWDR